MSQTDIAAQVNRVLVELREQAKGRAKIVRDSVLNPVTE